MSEPERDRAAARRDHEVGQGVSAAKELSLVRSLLSHMHATPSVSPDGDPPPSAGRLTKKARTYSTIVKYGEKICSRKPLKKVSTVQSTRRDVSISTNLTDKTVSPRPSFSKRVGVVKVLGRGEVWRGEPFFQEGLPSPRSLSLQGLYPPQGLYAPSPNRFSISSGV